MLRSHIYGILLLLWLSALLCGADVVKWADTNLRRSINLLPECGEVECETVRCLLPNLGPFNNWSKVEDVHLPKGCSDYVDGIVACYDLSETKAGLCAEEQNKVKCLLNSLNDVSDVCLKSAFFTDVTKAIGGVFPTREEEYKSSVTDSIRERTSFLSWLPGYDEALVNIDETVEKVEGLFNKVSSINPCIEDIMADTSCSGWHPVEIFECLKDKVTTSDACKAYINGLESCWDEATTLCNHTTGTDYLTCIYQNRARLSAACQASSYVHQLEESVNQIKNEIIEKVTFNNPIVSCGQEVKALECNTTSYADTYLCLSAKVTVGNFSYACKSYLEDSLSCLDSPLLAKCPMDSSFIECPWAHRDELLTEKCQNVLLSADVVGLALDRLPGKLPEPLVYDCIGDMSTLRCPMSSVEGVLDCLTDAGKNVTSQCLSHLDGVEGCLNTLKGKCPMDLNFMKCAWDNRELIATGCQNVLFSSSHATAALQRLTTSVMVPLDCVGDVEMKKCPVDGPIEGVLDCLMQAGKDLTAKCQAQLDGTGNCFTALKAKCPLDSSFMKCAWEHRDVVSNDCQETLFPDKVVIAGLQSIAKSIPIPLDCVVDINMQQCPVTSTVDTLDCLIRAATNLTNNCRVRIEGSRKCYDAVKSKCPLDSSFLGCVFENRHWVFEQCQNNTLISPYGKDITDAIRRLTQTVSLPTNCQTSSAMQNCPVTTIEATLECVVNASQILKKECMDDIDGTVNCYGEITKKCSLTDPNFLTCVWENRDYVTEECKRTVIAPGEITNALKSLTGGGITVPLDCLGDIKRMDCPVITTEGTLECLVNATSTLASNCAAHFKGIGNCTMAILHTCPLSDPTNFLPCVWTNRNSIWSQCQAHLGSDTGITAALQHLDIIPKTVYLPLDCVGDAQTRDCPVDTIEGTIECLKGTGQALQDKCQTRIQATQTCLESIKAMCPLNTNMLECVWDNRSNITAQCQDTLFSEFDVTSALQHMATSVSVPLDCLGDIEMQHCPMDSIEGTIQCLIDAASTLTANCKAHLPAAKDCFDSIQSKCPLDSDFAGCVWTNRIWISNKCQSVPAMLPSAVSGALTAPFDALTSALSEITSGSISVPLDCVVDIKVRECPVTTLDGTMDCLMAAGESLTQNCQARIVGVRECFENAKAVCPSLGVQCITNHSMSIMCHNKSLYEIADGYAADIFDEYLEPCMKDLNKYCLDDKVNSAVGCGTKLAQILTSGSCWWDIVKTGCSSINCFVSNIAKLGSSCKTVVEDAVSCFSAVPEAECQDTTTMDRLGQYVLLYTDPTTSQQCKDSPMYRTIADTMQMIADGLAHAELLECSDDVLNFCLDSSAVEMFQCLNDVRIHEGIDGYIKNRLSKSCKGLLADMYLCQEDVKEVCVNGTQDPVCIWQHRSELSAACKVTDYFNKLYHDFTKPVWGSALSAVNNSVLALTWPCGLDMTRLSDCSQKASPSNQMKCLTSYYYELTDTCKMYLLESKECLQSVGDLCPTERVVGDYINTGAFKNATRSAMDFLWLKPDNVWKDVSAWIVPEHACIWANRANASKTCLGSSFMEYWLFPRDVSQDAARIKTGSEQEGSTHKDETPDPETPGPPGPGTPGSETPNNTSIDPPYTIETPNVEAIDVWATYGKDQMLVMLAAMQELCTSDIKVHCEVEAGSPSIADEGARECLTKNLDNLNAECAMYHVGREACYADTQLVCGEKHAHLECLSDKEAFLSTDCQKSWYYQGLVAQGIMAETQMGVGQPMVQSATATHAVPVIIALISAAVMVIFAVVVTCVFVIRYKRAHTVAQMETEPIEGVVAKSAVWDGLPVKQQGMDGDVKILDVETFENPSPTHKVDIAKAFPSEAQSFTSEGTSHISLATPETDISHGSLHVPSHAEEESLDSYKVPPHTEADSVASVDSSSAKEDM